LARERPRLKKDGKHLLRCARRSDSLEARRIAPHEQFKADEVKQTVRPLGLFARDDRRRVCRVSGKWLAALLAIKLRKAYKMISLEQMISVEKARAARRLLAGQVSDGRCWVLGLSALGIAAAAIALLIFLVWPR
jgi:hypothetical protein